MDRNPRRVVPWWLIVCYLVSALAESRLLYNRGLSAANFKTPVGTSENVQPRASAVQQQWSSEVDEQPRTVVVRCHPDSMEIVVQADLFDTGLEVDGGHLRLGSNFLSEDSECGAVPSGEEDEFTILTQLTDCGTKLSSTEEKIIYSNVLVYSPEPSADGLLKLDGATIPVECHYEKRYSVAGSSLHPTWVPFVFKTSVDDQIDFNLQIMTDDWQFEKESYIYFLGDPIHFEVSAIMGNHLPLRVYVDHCVATATPDPESSLRYDFIEHGCLADAYLTNSNSRFLPRLEEHKLRFQMDAFNFYEEPSNQVYITCYLKAVPVTLAVGSKNRACSLIGNRWQSIDGSDQACRSCDISQRGEEPTTAAPKTTVATQAYPVMTSQERETEHYPATFVHFRPGLHQSIKAQQSSKLVKREAEPKAQQAIQLGPLTILPSSKFVSSELLAQKNKTA